MTNGFVWLALLVLFLVACSNKNISVEIEDKYGIAYNSTRQQIPLMLVNASMKFIEDLPGERYIYINQEEKGIKSPGYLYKTLTIDTAKKLSLETDCFINPQEKLYLFFAHDYNSNHTTITVQPINEENFSNPSTEIELPEADSILMAWGMNTPKS